MHLIDIAGRPDLAQVFLLRLRPEPWALVECVGALDPAVPAERKRVLVVSSQFGCPVRCAMCDAGSSYHGDLSAAEILGQIELLLERWAGPSARSCPKLKVQFARMGEPALNDALLEVLAELARRRELPGLLPCIATTAPRWRGVWFERLRELVAACFPGRFQLQISVQSTCEPTRRRMIPVPCWTLGEIAAFARRFVQPGDRKVTLNFALADGVELAPDRIAAELDPSHCLVKLTPLNETAASRRAGLQSVLSPSTPDRAAHLVERLRGHGFECVVSIGLDEETAMGSSCGQLALLHRLRRVTEGSQPQAAPSQPCS
jgi:23S rRNA (adenine2503-C2)-methyltransferase